MDPTGPLDLEKYCRDLVEEMQAGSGVRHSLEFTGSGPRRQVMVDVKRLRQILCNLLGNAIKYSPEGRRVRLTLTYEDGQATFDVQDRGLGIPEDAQARLFEAFHRARNVGTIPGTGLGLTIVKRSVDAHGGTIECVGREGHGTTFMVTLPVGVGAPVAEEGSGVVCE